ncbi:serine hydrolase domain-containing protein [Lacimicrobium alkaliphilum]|uniref:Serine hydrolase n=1 Tax=Lacimicrobium alkaliphilum TaxID=1526571 RepID=A0ABQ1RGJ6_9ALTE|nr:serine hydrolase [Lacimicrobium alkaliphilum]GGD67041.1 serine hydrolase [Lacimicrobium alkaliphilum]
MIKLLFTLIAVLGTGAVHAQYFPASGEWQSKAAAELGFETDKLEKAVKFARENEYSGSRDLRIAILRGFEREPFHTLLGPVKPRGGPAGMVVKNGYIAAQWGDLNRVDMTFSVTKSYLSSVAGVAVDQGLIGSTEDKVADTVWDGTFAGDHNSQIRWRHLLDQSSDWSGTLFGIKDWADRPPQHGGLDEWKFRTLNTPGTVMEYNDVRVNLLAYSLLQVFRQPLPQVLKQHIMDPIGASPTWRWFGYEDAWVTVDGLKMKSVTGGGHSGGGIFISTLDQARFGLMVLRNGRWKNRQILSKNWLQKATAPSPANASYGFMWWLNQGERKWQNVDDSSIFYAAGFGGNFIVVDKAQELMIVTRWLEPSQIGEMVRLVRDSLQQ